MYFVQPPQTVPMISSAPPVRPSQTQSMSPPLITRLSRLTQAHISPRLVLFQTNRAWTEPKSVLGSAYRRRSDLCTESGLIAVVTSGTTRGVDKNPTPSKSRSWPKVVLMTVSIFLMVRIRPKEI